MLILAAFAAVVVHHADLDPARPSDARRIGHGIETAVNMVCGEFFSGDPTLNGNIEVPCGNVEGLQSADRGTRRGKSTGFRS